MGKHLLFKFSVSKQDHFPGAYKEPTVFFAMCLLIHVAMRFFNREVFLGFSLCFDTFAWI